MTPPYHLPWGGRLPLPGVTFGRTATSPLETAGSCLSSWACELTVGDHILACCVELSLKASLLTDHENSYEATGWSR